MVLEHWSLRKGLALTLLAGVAHACGPGASGQSCPLQTWSGVCTFTNLNKVREVELPVPHGVYEAVYTPVLNQQSPNYTPPAVRIEVKTLSKHEGALQQHVARHPQIACQQTIKEGCSYNPVVAAFPEFDPTQYPVAAQDTGPQGCAKIEQQGAQGRVQVGQGSQNLPERFLFAPNVSNADPSMTTVAQQIAQQLNADPSIECVGVVGQSAAGESPGLGELRAQSIKRLLLEQGVAPHRMMTIGASTPLYGAGTEQQAPKAEDRRVTITVILRATTPAQ